MKIAVITPFFKGEKYLKDYLACMEDNANSLGEKNSLMVILVNDGDDSIEVDIPKLSFDLRIINNEENLGIHESRVRGLTMARESKADFVMFLDQDDLISYNALLKLADNIQDNDIIISNAKLEKKDWEGLWIRSDYQREHIWDLNTYIKVGTQIVSPGQCLIKTDAIPDYWQNSIIKVNGADDYFLWLIMIGKKASYIYFDEPLYIHKYTGENISQDTRATDESIYSFLPYLRESNIVSKADCDTLERMIRYKAKFRTKGLVGRVVGSLLNLDLFLENVFYKRRSKTPLGFNR